MLEAIDRVSLFFCFMLDQRKFEVELDVLGVSVIVKLEKAGFHVWLIADRVNHAGKPILNHVIGCDVLWSYITEVF